MLAAGSERVRKSAVTGARLKEAQHINKSLAALGDVLQAMDQKQAHIPFRNSKLTVRGNGQSRQRMHSRVDAMRMVLC